MMRNRRRGRTTTGNQPLVTLTPLIDMALTLLVIFMVATPMMHRAIKVELPKGNVDELKGAKPAKKEIVVYIDKQEHMYVNGDVIKKESELIPLIQRLAQELAVDLVMVKADEGVAYGKVITLVDAIKSIGGITYVALATQKPRTK